uniref:FtsW/RodA/SpoVE family cell cycle protein n=1 Tax=Ndongobacter massiliensis TaxID=1871025 RepID=UPI0009F808A5|nr:FtsW/RodA/SpoVE family cell cycle protein [Ndongobacter massiliensis]
MHSDAQTNKTVVPSPARKTRRLHRFYYASGKWLVLVFQLFALALVLGYRVQELTPQAISLSVLLLVGTFVSTTLISRFTPGDSYLLLIAQALFSIGVVMILRIDFGLGVRQMFMYLVGMAVYFVVYLFFRATKNIWMGKTIFFFALTAGLLLVTLVFGTEIHGAKNWISLGGVLLQPSELAKLSFVFFIASWYYKRENVEEMEELAAANADDLVAEKKPKSRRGIFGTLGLLVGTYLLIGIFFLQKELGTAIVFFIVLTAAQFSYERRPWQIVLNIVVAGAGLYLAYRLFHHIRVRFDIWLDPWSDSNDKGYQIVQSLFALAEGGFFGTGIGLGHPDTIPLGYSDFIFASIVEEMGAFMGICVMMLFALLVYRGFKVAMEQARDFYSVLALCVSALFAAQALIMFAGVMKVIPLTGITIPFLTSGGSSLVASFSLLAVLQVCSEPGQTRPRKKGGRRGTK